MSFILWHELCYLVAEVALGGLGVGVKDEGVGDPQPRGHLHVHPGGPAYSIEAVSQPANTGSVVNIPQRPPPCKTWRDQRKKK